MIRSRLRIKALGLCAMVLGLMAFSASAAQAEVNAKWWINGAPIGASHLLPTVELGEIENKTASLLTTIAGAKVEYLCTEANLTGAKLELEGKITAGGKVLFKKCITKLNGVLSPVCVPKTAGLANGEIATDEGKGLLELHVTAGGVKEDVVKISPTREDLRFARILHNVAEGCSLPEAVPVFGHLVLHDPVDNGLTEEGAHGAEHKFEHLILQHSLTKLWVISNTAEHAANIDGSAWVKLGGVHAGLKWKGVPG